MLGSFWYWVDGWLLMDIVGVWVVVEICFWCWGWMVWLGVLWSNGWYVSGVLNIVRVG